MLLEGSNHLLAVMFEERYVLLSSVVLLFISWKLLDPLHSLGVSSRRLDIFAVVKSLVLLVDQGLHRLSVVYPLQNTESIGHWDDSEGFDVQISVLACWVLLEDTIHDPEELLYSLIEAQVFTTFD